MKKKTSRLLTAIFLFISSTSFAVGGPKKAGFLQPFLDKCKDLLSTRKGSSLHETVAASEEAALPIVQGESLPSPISPIEPLSSVAPRTPADSKTLLLKQLTLAQSEKRYVSFKVRETDDQTPHLFEGWVTGVEGGVDSSFQVSEDAPEGPSRPSSYRLENILLGTFDPFPTLKVEAASVADPGIEVTAYTESASGKVTPTQISAPLISKLSVFGDVYQASGATLPVELERMVLPGQTLRIYFASGSSQVRLTVRRSKDSRWSFGDTALDRPLVNESYEDESAESDRRYTPGERTHLESSLLQGRLPAARLRAHMRTIRNQLLRSAIAAELE